MSDRPNLNAYALTEALSNYETRESLLAYRSSRLQRYRAVVDCIKARSAPSSRLSVLEVGSGSSALLYALVTQGVLAEGLGIELSPSRSEFAERWRADGGFHGVRNVNANFADVDTGTSRWDWWIVIDNTFTYLRPEDERYPGQLLHKAWVGLMPGGRILLDMINYSNRHANVEQRD